MTLSAPVALLGLLTLPVIAALHMLRSRSRRYPVSSLALWDFLSPQLHGSSARRLPLTWLLLLDLLIAALFSLALAGPRLVMTRTMLQGRQRILLLDVSTSMAAEDEGGSRLEVSTSDAGRLIRTSSGEDVITLIAYSSKAWSVADSRLSDPAGLLAALAGLQPTGAGDRLEAALALARASMDADLPAEIHIFTDAAFPAPDLEGFDTPIEWHLYGSGGGNQAVLSVSAVPLSENKFQVFARFANFSAASAARRALVFGDGRLLASAGLELEPESTLARTWELVGSPGGLRIAFEESDALPLDDSASAGMPARGAGPLVSAALVTEQPGPLLRALEAVPGTEVQVISPDEYLPGSPFDLVVLRGTLPERWPAGTVLVADPPLESALLGEFHRMPVTSLPFPHPDPLTGGVDFTGVRWDTASAPVSPLEGFEVLLSAGDIPLLLHGRVGLADIVLLLAETAGENGTPGAFARHPAFPVLVANTVRLAAGASLPQQVALGETLRLPDPGRYPQVVVLDSRGEPTPIADGEWTAGEPGLYTVELGDIDGKLSRFHIGVNAGDLHESDIRPGDWPAGLEAAAMPAATSEQPLPLAPWLLSFAALLMVLEAWPAWR